eukprot:gene23009-30200_t
MLVEDMLDNHIQLPNVAFLITANPDIPPARRAGDQPWITVAEGMLPESLVQSLNVVAQGLEAALGRSLYPLDLRSLDFSAGSGPQHPNSTFHTSAGLQFTHPFAVWDASLGVVHIDKSIVEGTWKLPNVEAMMQLLSDTFISGMSNALHKVSSLNQMVQRPADLWSYIGPVAAAAVPAAFALVPPPLWFCALCPALLGLLFPLLWNVVIEKTAAMLCEKMKLEDDECFDLLLGALALAFILSLASVIPIIYICKMSECAHRKDNTTVVTRQRLFRSFKS